MKIYKIGTTKHPATNEEIEKLKLLIQKNAI